MNMEWRRRELLKNSLHDFSIVRLIWKPRCHIAAVGHALILFDFLRRFLTEMRIGEFRKEVAEEVAIDGIMGADIFGSYTH